MTDGEIVLTRDRSSGHVHKRVRLGNGLATLEGDNLDESGLYDILDSLADVDPADLCKHCFPQPEREQALMDTAQMGTD
jgi:hypothetical protein